MASNDLGIEMGTSKLCVCSAGRVLLHEATVAVCDLAHEGQVVSMGNEAYGMMGRVPRGMKTVRPIINGTIADFDMAAELLRFFLGKAMKNGMVRPQIIFSIPASLTNVEARALINTGMAIGARRVCLLETTLAAALGQGIDLSRPKGYLIADLGAGTCDVAVTSMYGTVVKNSTTAAGDAMDNEIIRMMRMRYGMIVGMQTARSIKHQIGRVDQKPAEDCEVRGLSIYEGLPRKVVVRGEDVRTELLFYAEQIAQSIASVLEKTPPELVSDLTENPMVMVGGLSRLQGLREFLEGRLRTEIISPERPDEVVARGASMAFDCPDEVFTTVSQVKTAQREE